MAAQRTECASVHCVGISDLINLSLVWGHPAQSIAFRASYTNEEVHRKAPHTGLPRKIVSTITPRIILFRSLCLSEGSRGRPVKPVTHPSSQTCCRPVQITHCLQKRLFFSPPLLKVWKAAEGKFLWECRAFLGLVHLYNVGIVFHCTLPFEGKDAKNVTEVWKSLGSHGKDDTSCVHFYISMDLRAVCEHKWLLCVFVCVSACVFSPCTCVCVKAYIHNVYVGSGCWSSLHSGLYKVQVFSVRPWFLRPYP